jgi:hypothetical protein
MIPKIKKLIPLFELAVIIGIITFFLTLLTTTLWQNNGISMVEILMLPLVGGFYLFLTTLIVNIICINKVRELVVKNKEQHTKKFFQVLIVISISILIYTMLDSIYFLFDNSLSIDYTRSLVSLFQSSNEKYNDMINFEKLPFSIQNLFSNLFSVILAGLISLLFIKKDGEIFKSKNDKYYR